MKTRNSATRKNLMLLILSWFLAFFFITCTKDNPTGVTKTNGNTDTKIVGTVIQSDANAKVFLTQGRPLDSTSSAVSDGQFEFNNLQPGNYVIKIIAQDYDTFYINAIVDEGKSIYVGAVFLAHKLSLDPISHFEDSIPSVFDHYPKDKFEILFNPYTYYTGSDPSRLCISFSFDRPMDRESVRKALKIDPPVQGYFVWSQNRQTYTVPQSYGNYAWTGAALMASDASRFYIPQAPAEITTYNTVQSFTYYFNMSDSYTDTTYTITLSMDAKDTGGVPLDSVHTYSFRTVQSAVAYDDVEMDPHHGEDYVDLFRNQGITITFPKRMNQASVENHFTLVPADANAILLWQDYNKLVVLTSGRILVPDTTYILTLDSASMDADGQPLGETKVLNFSTRSIMVKSTVPDYGDMMVSPSATLTITFNTYMDKNSFTNRIFLVSGGNDTISGTVDYYHYTIGYDTVWEKEQIMFDPASLLKSDEKYTLYIGLGVTDRLGYPMRKDYKLVFVTMP